MDDEKVDGWLDWTGVVHENPFLRPAVDDAYEVREGNFPGRGGSWALHAHYTRIMYISAS